MQSVTNNPDFMQQLRADLHWLITSPQLITDHAEFIDDGFWLSQAVDIEKALENTALIEASFADLRPMVGLYFERLVLFWLKSNPAFENIRQHIRLSENKKTIGEMDFLFNDTAQTTSFHWEVAVKYFLLYERNDQLQLIGPNPVDTYEKKYLKMRQHQLPLSSLPLAKDILLELNYTFPPQTRGLVKGCLFYPSDSDWRNPPHLFDSISKIHNRGWWTSNNELNLPTESNDSQWIILSKPYWFALTNLEKRKKFQLNELKYYLKKHFNNTNHGVFLAELVQNKNQWSEVSRGFVVNATWPQT